MNPQSLAQPPCPDTAPTLTMDPAPEMKRYVDFWKGVRVCVSPLTGWVAEPAPAVPVSQVDVCEVGKRADVSMSWEGWGLSQPL